MGPVSFTGSNAASQLPRYADFHIHVGNAGGNPVKMAAAKGMTFAAVVQHARTQKGLDIITVIDGCCTGVLEEVKEMAATGVLVELPDGGLLHDNGLVIFLGSEVEVAGPSGGAAHFGCWFPNLQAASDFSFWLGTVQTNVTLSSQRARTDAATLAQETHARDGMFIVHHAFTPHKGAYGNCVVKLADMLPLDDVDALELGLSADTAMADRVSELEAITFLTNSDAHSTTKIAREYNALQLTSVTFGHVRNALSRSGSDRVTANYGLHPALGKYHKSRCKICNAPWPPEQFQCPTCGGRRQIMGVSDRLETICDLDEPSHPGFRPPYIHQIPLEFIPGLGPVLRNRLLQAFGTEMDVLHRVSVDDLSTVVGQVLAHRIDDARHGRLKLREGGGGIYGKVMVGE